jgi:diadenosine tetraphosphate (Ap4A) HIT family hydrolase
MTQPTPKPCLFCVLPQQRIVMVSGLAMAIRDAYPVSPGHTLIVPKRHVATFFDTTSEERLSMFELLDKAKRALDVELQPAAYNIGVNDGPAAGQTIPHVHVHLIPRYAGDDDDPRGGVRWIFPMKAKYWT